MKSTTMLSASAIMLASGLALAAIAQNSSAPQLQGPARIAIDNKLLRVYDARTDDCFIQTGSDKAPIVTLADSNYSGGVLFVVYARGATQDGNKGIHVSFLRVGEKPNTLIVKAGEIAVNVLQESSGPPANWKVFAKK
jgi:hypothetical protein